MQIEESYQKPFDLKSGGSGSKGRFVYEYQAGLEDSSTVDSPPLEDSPYIDLALERKPFCCDAIRARRYGVLPVGVTCAETSEKDHLIVDFITSRGSSNAVFEITAQVENGPLLSIKYYSLRHGERILVKGEFTRIRDCLLNQSKYACSKHQRVYSIRVHKGFQSDGISAFTN